MPNHETGLVTRSNALAQGMTDGELRAARRRRELVTVRPGVYMPATTHDGHDPYSRHRLAAHAAAAVSDAVVSHVSAAVLHGLAVWSVPLAKVHMTVDRRSGGKGSTHRVLHAARLPSEDVVVLDSVRTTSVARTVLDLAHTVPFEQAVVTCDDALARALVTVDDLTTAFARRPGRRGAPAARRVLAFADARSESVGESRSRVLFHRHGFELPELQASMHTTDGRFIARVDFLWRELGVVGEFDGFAKYSIQGKNSMRGGGEIEVLRREKLREDALRAHGWSVARWTWEHLEQPESVLTRVRYAATAAAACRSPLVTAAPTIASALLPPGERQR
ncbi:hypothetical protein [Rhodococcus sp. HNM0569]|uniref:hypothetical protein n=1 Tax=Rhodococcus sp. HNM0569 TaxID=2716340 RepID=UPI00146CDFC5|nr:hypothetical protein [Rhodococcus sp. HNM0569]NLU84630.1 hypothetical protein [Rhodococcus sp. HNM0569]